ncbi:LlaJI family restriction endonuclease [Methanobrevibacter sp.]|uniref:LlaJI family restriction endonuclease n=1 Tax=Methanobrevibacter sp. TaxID=66852 RepID=UPI00388E0F32
MNSIYIRELKHYSKAEILEIIDEKAFEKLTSYAIIDKDEDSYQFKFVGVIIVDDMVINCYPKYIPNTDNIKDDFKQIISVIKKYKSLNEEIDYSNENLEDISFNLLSMMVFFLEDYFENGIYTNIQNILESNGNGEIDWNRTVNYTNPIIKNNKPYYTELQTRYKINDLFDYFHLLHEYIITDCSRRLESAGLIDLFDLTPVELSHHEQDDFGEITEILEKLTKELNVEFNSHKQKLLKSMHAYLAGKNSFSNDNYLTVFGTNTYHVVWEDVCRRVFGDKLNKSLREILNDSNSYTKLIDVIKKPEWHLKEGTFKVDTFRPDLITFWNGYFVILDAKYYKLKVTEKLEKQPGLSDVTKQYLYELAYREFIEENNFKGVKNAFLMPSYENQVENKGYVEIGILHDLGLENIQVIMLPAGEMNQLYLENRKMSISRLFLIS